MHAQARGHLLAAAGESHGGEGRVPFGAPARTAASAT